MFLCIFEVTARHGWKIFSKLKYTINYNNIEYNIIINIIELCRTILYSFRVSFLNLLEVLKQKVKKNWKKKMKTEWKQNENKIENKNERKNEKK